MENDKDDFLKAKLSDDKDKQNLRRWLAEDSAEGDMSRAFEAFKNTVRHPEQVKRPRWRGYWVAAASVLVIVSSVLVHRWLSNDVMLKTGDWEQMTGFEKIAWLNEATMKEADQRQLWGYFSTEDDINVKMAMLRIMIPNESIEQLIEEETSPLVKSTLVSMNN